MPKPYKEQRFDAIVNQHMVIKMSAVVFNEKLAKQVIKEYILLQKTKNTSLIEAAHVSTKLEIPYNLVKEIFYQLAQEGIFSSLEYIPA
ncbi:MAG: hypothetical protein ACW967_00780 [Candidatus Hodarchaeales archaeon]